MTKSNRPTVAAPAFENNGGEILATVMTYLASDKSELYRSEKQEQAIQEKLAGEYAKVGRDNDWLLAYMHEAS